MNKNTEKRRNGTRIVACSCKHEYQDKVYGTGKRVANAAPKQDGDRCTVCGTVHK